ncbi:MAG: fibronectin type III domain-containing protein, partial [Elusimicrobia bacterium]|nr:fibronectin type III domain-containing protein [Elusimicrobiota bacterium]
MIHGNRKRLPFLSVLLGCAICVLPDLAKAQICTEVRLEIKQEATLEREAFDAALEIHNNFPNYGLENFRVNIIIKDSQGNSADNLFFVKISSKQGVNALDGTGIVQPASTATIHWLIIPSTGAGGINPLGLKYSVKADISYKLSGVLQSISTFEDFITVKPQPVLNLEYVLPFEVFSDEPLTDAIEPVEPFALGVRVTNIGYGPAKNFQINSGQPEIIENEQGLAIDFKLLGTYVGQNKIPDTLLISFGDIQPGGVSQASWIMSTSLSGRFTQFKATFTHSAELGGELTSLLQSVTTYTLIKDVLVDLPGRDSHFDFLVNTTTPRGETMENLLNAGGEILPNVILESDQILPIPVYHLLSELSGTPTAADPALSLKVSEDVAPSLWIHISTPVSGGMALASVKRSDGKTLSFANAWISRHFNKLNTSYSYRLNILDYDAPKFAEYKAEFSLESVNQAPGAVTISAESIGSGAIRLTWAAPGEDGNIGDMIGARYLIQAELDAGAAFNPVNAQAQVNITTNTKPGVIQSYVVSGLAGNATYYLKLWTQDTSGNISADSNMAHAYTMPNPPKEPVIIETTSDTMKIAWTIGNNFFPINYQVTIDTDSIEPYVAESDLFDFTITSYTFAGLVPNTTYFIKGLAKNPATGVSSEKADFGSIVTLAAEPGGVVSHEIFTSSISIVWNNGGNPDVTEYFVRRSTSQDMLEPVIESGWIKTTTYTFENLLQNTTYYADVKARNHARIETAWVSLGSFRIAVLDIIAPDSNISFSAPNYGTEPVFISSLTFIAISAHDDATVSGDRRGQVKNIYYSVDSTTTFNVYQDTFSITAEGPHIIRFYAEDSVGNTEAVKITSVTADNTWPVTSFGIEGPKYQGAELLYVSALSSVTLTAFDEYSGLKEIRYELDSSAFSSTSAVFINISTEGVHTLAYGSIDNLGNTEPVRISSVAMDNTGPLCSFEVKGSSKVIDSVLYVIAGSTVNAICSDNMSGVKALYYESDGSTGTTSAYDYVADTHGVHLLRVNAADNVDNIGAEISLLFSADKEPPISDAFVSGDIGLNDWYVSTVTVMLVSTDTLAGLKAIYYSTSAVAEPFTLYSLPFTETSEGRHTVRYYAEDMVGNVEQEKSISFKIDLTSPIVTAVSSPTANEFGWNNIKVTVTFIGTDTVSGISYCTTEQVISQEGSSQTVTGYCMDYAGWSSTKTLIVNIDTSAPNISYAQTPVANEFGWNNTNVTLKFTCIDNLSGVKSCPA